MVLNGYLLFASTSGFVPKQLISRVICTVQAKGFMSHSRISLFIAHSLLLELKFSLSL